LFKEEQVLKLSESSTHWKAPQPQCCRGAPFCGDAR